MDDFCHIANRHIGDFVTTANYAYASCYLWNDRKLYDSFGDIIQSLKGNTIYLFQESTTPLEDFFHEAGHAVSRHFNVVGHCENGWRGHWDDAARQLAGSVNLSRHWSSYLNLYALQQEDFSMNAASEIWAELYMLSFLRPGSDEIRYIIPELERLQRDPGYRRLHHALQSLQAQLGSDLLAGIGSGVSGSRK